MFSFINEGTKNKINILKEKFDKYFTIIITSLWIISTLWDIIRFHCYWSDYILELYSCFFFIFMALYFIIPAKIPKIIIDKLGFIKTILGRSITMIFFSILFLGDKHLFHKLCSIFLFVGGMIVLIMELISPEKKESEKYYESNDIDDNKNEKENENNEDSRNDSNPPTKLDDDSQQGQSNVKNLNNFNDFSENGNNNDNENNNKDIIEQN